MKNKLAGYIFGLFTGVAVFAAAIAKSDIAGFYVFVSITLIILWFAICLGTWNED